MRTIIILSLIVYSLHTNAQNLCPNSSFEGSQHWVIKDNGDAFAGIFTPNSQDGITFPYDIFNSQPNNTNPNMPPSYCTVPDNYFGYENPVSGIRYAGLFGGAPYDASYSENRDAFMSVELTTPLENDKDYVIRFFVSKMDNSTQDVIGKIRLTKERGSAGGPQNTIIKHKFTVRNLDGWEEVRIILRHDWLNLISVDLSDCKYLFFQRDDNYLIGPPYHATGFYLDEITVMEKCEFDGNSCYTTGGTINPYLGNNPCMSDRPLTIGGLDNVTEADITITPLSGQGYFHTNIKSCEGISTPFEWNGGLFNGGGISPAAAAGYLVTLDLKNLCYNEVITYTFAKWDNSFANNTLQPAYPTDCPPTLIPGCSPYIYVDKIFVPGESAEYIATNTIRTSNYVEVHPQSSVEFVAGEKIVLSEGFKAYTGCYFNARIDAGGQYREPVETTVLKSDSTTISKIENSEISFSVFPNPSSNVITLRIDADNSLNASINIYNNEGKNVFMVFNNQRIYKTSNIILDISFLHPGIYYCELIAGEYKKSIKLIKT